MLSNTIIKEIKRYLQYLKNTKINNDHNELLASYHSITNEVDNITKTNPYLLMRYMHGGADLGKRYGGIMDKISDVFGKYMNIDTTGIKTTTNEIEKELDALLKMLDEIERDLDKTQTDPINNDKIINALQMIKISMEKFATGVKLYSMINQINIPVEKPMNYTVKSGSHFNDMLTDIKTRFETIRTTMGKAKDDNDNKLKPVLDDVNAGIKGMKEEMGKMQEVIELVQKEWNVFFESFKITVNKDSVNIIPTIEELQKIIEKTKIDDNFKRSMGLAYIKFQKKIIKERDYVDLYNELASNYTADQLENLPTKYFDGRYTVRLSNNILVNKDDTLPKLDLISDIISTEYGKMKYEIQSKKEIYIPNFTEMKTKMEQKAGALIDDLGTQIGEFSDILKNYLVKYEDYKIKVKEYNKIYVSNIAHMLFLLLVVFNQVFTQYYVIYTYINRGIIEFYKRVINGIYNKIVGGDITDPILYMRKYHFVTIMKLHAFLNEMSTKDFIKTDSIIDINECDSGIKHRFVLLNYFKTIMESYNESYQNKITIYARINDFKHPISGNINKGTSSMFISDYDRRELQQALMKETTNEEIKNDNLEPSNMWIRKEPCDGLKTSDQKVEKIQFTEVFDSSHFKFNGDISKYMTLDTQLSKGKSVAIMTYGYSGTGKTFTLFGDKARNIEGMLQSTLDNINGLQEVDFRLFEIYGLGTPFPNYWKNETNLDESRIDKIAHRIFTYKIEASANGFTFCKDCVNTVPANKIAQFIKDDTYTIEGQTELQKSFVKVEGNNISKIFRVFDEFVNSVDDYRVCKERTPSYDEPARITATVNNRVSSRSVIVYDFRLKLSGNDEPVSFLIIDLPGREEIMQTYVEPYVSNPVIKQLLIQSHKPNDENNFINKIGLLLSCLSLNPLAVPVFAPELVFNYINGNKFDAKLRNKLITDPINISYTLESGTKMEAHTLLNEYINRQGWRLGDFFESNGSKIELNTTTKKFGHNYLKINENPQQYYGLACIHIMNRLIQFGRFDVISDIYRLVVDNLINNKVIEKINTFDEQSAEEKLKKLQEANFKSEQISNYLASQKPNKMEFLKSIVKYEYLLTPFEGIYINENIIGLIQFLATRLFTSQEEKDKFIQSMLKPNQSLNFQYQQKVARRWLMSGGDSADAERFFKFNENIKEGKTPNHLYDTNLNMITENLKEEYEKMKTIYKSNAIFNEKKPLITDVLEPYISKINDYKVFYLFGNYEDSNVKNLKCQHQYALLNSTRDFIKSITKM